MLRVVYSGYCLVEVVTAFSIEPRQSAVPGAGEGSHRAARQRLQTLDVFPLQRDEMFNSAESRIEDHKSPSGCIYLR